MLQNVPKSDTVNTKHLKRAVYDQALKLFRFGFSERTAQKINLFVNTITTTNMKATIYKGHKYVGQSSW